MGKQNSAIASRVAPGSQIVRLKLSPPVNAYLVLGGTERILVDTGHAASAPMLLEALKQICGPDPITAIVLTHGHHDHTGGLPFLAEATHVPVYAHPDEIPFLTGQQSYGELRRSAFNFHSKQKDSTLAGIEIRPLPDGARLGPLTALHTPGHTPGHLALWHEGEQTAICGDMLMHLAGRLMGPVPFFTYDAAMNRRSVRRVLEAGVVQRLCPAHGEPIVGGADKRIEAYVKRVKP